MTNQESNPPIDRFLYRLVAITATASALMTTTYAVIFALIRGPGMRTLLHDFDIELPAVTVWIVSRPWLPLIAAVLALLFGVVASVWPGRRNLPAACGLTIASVASCFMAEIAVRLPLESLFRSLS